MDWIELDWSWRTGMERSPSSSLRIIDRSFQYASPSLWNQLPASLFVNHALISSILTRPILWVALPASVPSTRHSHPSPLRSLSPGLKPSLSELIRFYFLVFLFSHLLVFGSVRWIKLTYMSAFERTLNSISYRINISQRMNDCAPILLISLLPI